MTQRDKSPPETDLDDRDDDITPPRNVVPQNDRETEDDDRDVDEGDETNTVKPIREPYSDPGRLPYVREPTPDPSDPNPAEQDTPAPFPEKDH